MTKRSIVRPVNMSLLAVCCVLTLASCSRNRELVLPGERLDLRDPLLGVAAETGDPLDATEEPVETDENQALPINLSWRRVPMRHGRTVTATASHRIDHPALNASLTEIWSVNIGSGDSRKYRITADPVVADGRVFAMDSRSQVTALAAEIADGSFGHLI